LKNLKKSFEINEHKILLPPSESKHITVSFSPDGKRLGYKNELIVSEVLFKKSILSEKISMTGTASFDAKGIE